MRRSKAHNVYMSRQALDIFIALKTCAEPVVAPTAILDKAVAVAIAMLLEPGKRCFDVRPQPPKRRNITRRSSKFRTTSRS
jgi:hypothetical protein